MRNPEFGVGHLEKWGEMLQILKDISANRMPNVADLLKQSSQAQGTLTKGEGKSPPMAGNIHVTPTGKTSPPPEAQKPQPMVPKIVDAESSQQPASTDEDEREPGKGKSRPKLKLPITTVASTPPKKDKEDEEKKKTPEEDKLDEAVVVQKDLLAEFEKIADELNKVLANLEGSTLVKRLKAASREQYVVAGKIGDKLGETFGMRGRAVDGAAKNLHELSDVEMASSQKVSTIMDDMQAYFERRRFQRFKTVLDEMREQDAVGSLRQLGDDVRLESGMSIAQCEFWSDSFDRWADNLVDPACGKCQGCKAKGCLPPSLILEAMKILEAEVNLREETRVAEQAKAAIEAEEFAERASKLCVTQESLSERVTKLNDQIKLLPDAQEDFGFEIALLGRVEQVMDEATGILNRPETGNPAIAAETEAIELLLRSKRINPKGGGGGGSSPGGGGQGTTNDSALALLGNGMNDKEVREDRGVSQATGEAGNALPEEFRAGLDEYFNRLERDHGTD